MSEPALPPGNFIVDMLAQAAAGRYSSLAGREQELDALGSIILRRSKRNPLLLGEPGVGKTALVEGFASRVVEGRTPFSSGEVSLYGLCLGGLLSGTSYRGDLETRVRDLLLFLGKCPRQRFLFIDELHLLFRAGRSEGGLDVASLLKPFLARGDLSVIGASTNEEWGLVAEADPALARRFQVIRVNEPGPKAALDMLRAAAADLSRYHGLEIPHSLLEQVLSLSSQYPGLSRLPDRAIDFLDDACVHRLQGMSCRVRDPALAPARSASRRAFRLRDYAREKWSAQLNRAEAPLELRREDLLAVAARAQMPTEEAS